MTLVLTLGALAPGHDSLHGAARYIRLASISGVGCRSVLSHLPGGELACALETEDLNLLRTVDSGLRVDGSAPTEARCRLSMACTAHSLCKHLQIHSFIHF